MTFENPNKKSWQGQQNQNQGQQQKPQGQQQSDEGCGCSGPSSQKNDKKAQRAGDETHEKQEQQIIEEEDRSEHDKAYGPGDARAMESNKNKPGRNAQDDESRDEDGSKGAEGRPKPPMSNPTQSKSGQKS